MPAIKVLSRITPTTLSRFSDCRLQWYWANAMGFRPISRQPVFDLGRGVHVALEKYYNAKKKGKTIDLVARFTRWADEEIDGLSDDSPDLGPLVHTRTMGITMLEGYVEEYADEKFDIIYVEEEVERQLPGTDWTISCKIDAVVRWRGKPWVLEHKTFTSMRPDYLTKDHQFVAEAWCAQTLLDEPIQGVIYNGLRKMVPGPKVKNPLFERHYIEVNDQKVKVFLKRAKDMYRTMTQGKLAIYPEPSPVRCSMCAFKDPCDMYQSGEDFQMVLDTRFTTREERASG